MAQSVCSNQCRVRLTEGKKGASLQMLAVRRISVWELQEAHRISRVHTLTQFGNRTKARATRDARTTKAGANRNKQKRSKAETHGTCSIERARGQGECGWEDKGRDGRARTVGGRASQQTQTQKCRLENSTHCHPICQATPEKKLQSPSTWHSPNAAFAHCRRGVRIRWHLAFAQFAQ